MRLYDEYCAQMEGMQDYIVHLYIRLVILRKNGKKEIYQAY